MNKTDEAYTENRAGRRGDRDSPKVDIAPKLPFQSARVLTYAEANTRASVKRRREAEATLQARV